MKNKKLCFLIAGAIGFIAMIVAMCLPTWGVNIDGVLDSNHNTGIFTEFNNIVKYMFIGVNGDFYDVWFILSAIFATLLAVSVLVFIITSLIKLKRKKTKKLALKIILAIMLVSFVCLVVFGILFTTTNAYKIVFVTKIVPLVGFYLLVCGGFVSCVSALFLLDSKK